MPLIPLPIVAEVAPGANPNDTPGNWNFTGEGLRWRAKAGIEMDTGRDDEDDEVKPGSCHITFDDRDGRLSPRNVLGPWYGDIGTNTPMRVMLTAVDDAFTRTVASGWGVEPQSGTSWGHSSTSMWSVSGGVGRVAIPTSNTLILAQITAPQALDSEMVHVSAVDQMPTGGAWAVSSMLRRVDGNNHYRLNTEFQPDGTIKVKIVRLLNGDGLELVELTNTGVTFTAGTRIMTRAQAVGRTLQIRVWRESDPEPAVWHARASDVAHAGGVAGLLVWRIATNAGTMSGYFDNLKIRTALFTGQVPEWPVRWPERSGADCVAPVSASGILRWLGQGQPPLQSPISQQLASRDPQAHWRLEDGNETTNPGSALPRPRGVPASATAATFGNDDAPPGALSSVSLDTMGVSKISGRVASWRIPQVGYSIIGYYRFPNRPAVGVHSVFLEVLASGTVTRWTVTSDDNSFGINAYDKDGDPIPGVATTILHGIDVTKWFALRLRTSQESGVVRYSIAWHLVGSDIFFYSGETTYAGTTTRANAVTLSAAADGMLATQLFVGAWDTPFIATTVMLVSAGYAGETDVARVARVLGDAGIEVAVHAGTGVALGPQPRDATALEVARDAEKAGMGLLYERGAVLGYLPFSARINGTVTMALDWELGHLAEAPEPVDDDLELVNRWTSSRPNGSERTVEDAASIARHRPYADGDEVNVNGDEQLTDDASWHVAVGTRDVLRWPRITIDLVRNPQLITPWLRCRVGSRITLANLPGQVAGEVGDFVILGYAQSIAKHRWRVEITCAPAVPWTQVGSWGAGRMDSQTTTLAAPVANATTTTVSITSKWYEDTWASAGGYVWRVNGEPMQVVSVTAPTGAPGAYTQTATVIRSTTLAKAHPAGKAVRLAEPARWSVRN